MRGLSHIILVAIASTMALQIIAFIPLICYYKSMPSFRYPEKGLETFYRTEMYDAFIEWKKFAAAIDLSKLLVLAINPPEETEDGDIYELETPTDLLGDFVVVDMKKVRVDTPHSHTNGEVEVHIPLAGSARMSLGDMLVLDLMRDKDVPVAPEKPHFVMPDDQYIAGVLSLPNYNPDNQIPVDLTRRYTENFNLQLYEATLGNAQ